MSVSIQELEDLVHRSDEIIKHIKTHIFSPEGEKHFKKTFKIGEASTLIGRHPATIREAEKQGAIDANRTGNSSARGFTLTEINKARRHFNTLPRLGTDEEAAVLAVQNFKGGVGKTNIAVHLSQWLAIRGFRVLLIDLDSQASATTLFGYTPDMDIDADDTLLPFFEGQQRTMHYAIRDTKIENLSLIPANLQVYNAEYMVAAKHSQRPIYSYLPQGVEDIKKDFEIIIIDPPPALGMLSINALVAATSLLIPMPPRMLDFTSSLQFFNMLHETLEEIQGHIGQQIDYDFVKLVTSKKKQRTSNEKYARAEDDILDLAKKIFGREYMLDSIIYESTAIDNAACEFKTLFEIEGQTTSYKSYRTAIASIEAVCEEVLHELLINWPNLKSRIKAA
jgi:chromosome partitioning protein